MKPQIDKYYVNNYNLSQLLHNITLIKENITLTVLQMEMAQERKAKATTHIVTDYDTLRSIANKYYSNIDYWRKLGKYNSITGDLVAGTSLLIPSKEILNGI